MLHSPSLPPCLSLSPSLSPSRRSRSLSPLILLHPFNRILQSTRMSFARWCSWGQDPRHAHRQDPIPRIPGNRCLPPVTPDPAPFPHLEPALLILFSETATEVCYVCSQWKDQRHQAPQRHKRASSLLVLCLHRHRLFRYRCWHVRVHGCTCPCPCPCLCPSPSVGVPTAGA